MIVGGLIERDRAAMRCAVTDQGCESASNFDPG
jgi:hypothetical protein